MQLRCIRLYPTTVQEEVLPMTYSFAHMRQACLAVPGLCTDDDCQGVGGFCESGSLVSGLALSPFSVQCSRRLQSCFGRNKHNFSLDCASRSSSAYPLEEMYMLTCLSRLAAPAPKQTLTLSTPQTSSHRRSLFELLRSGPDESQSESWSRRRSLFELLGFQAPGVNVHGTV